MDTCNIKVAIKVRPLNQREQLINRIYWKIDSNGLIHVDPVTEKRNGEQFFFDRVFGEESANYDVFDEIVKPIIDRGIQGFHGTVLAYGQTASGKTYTMSGDQSNPGVISLAVNYMFSAMNNSTSREYLLRASYLEIYNEKVKDLLDEKSQTRKIEIQKDGLQIIPLKAIVCQNAQMVFDLMKIGEKNRSIGETNMNERSSRSHTILRFILESRNVDDDCDGAYQQSVINLVDLAGSERSSQTQSSMERFKEGCKINSSLTTLGLVIQQLSECPDSSQHINFRDSKLTRILQTSLGGNSLTAIICTVTLAVDDQTQNTLSFASRAKKIKNVAKVNENVTDETLLKRYRVQLSKLNKELEGIKQNQNENDEVNEIKYKYQVEKRTNEELKERIMRLQNNMITASTENKNQSSNKKAYQRRRTWGGKLDNTFTSNSALETIEEDVNMPRPSVPSDFGNQNKEFKTPLEPFEWDLIREEDRTVDIESINNDIKEHEISPPCRILIPSIICETPKKVLRERVNNYKNMFEMSMKENNELREFTTLEKQMFHDNNEQLKDLDNLKKKLDSLQSEKTESAKLIEKLKCSVQLVENEKRDVEVVMEMQKDKYEKRESELLATIQDARDELRSKEEQLKKVILHDTFMAEKHEEIKRLEMKIKEVSQMNNTYIDEIETLKTQLTSKDQELSLELSKNCSLLKDLSILQNQIADSKSIPCTIKFLANEGYFTLRKHEILELDQLLKHIQNTVEQMQFENQNLKDENNNLKLMTNNFTTEIYNRKRENDELRAELILIETNIKSIIKEFTASVDIDVDNSELYSLIEFAADHFEQNTNEINKLSGENVILNEKLVISNDKLGEIKTFVFENLGGILESISTLEINSSTEVEEFKKELLETIEENLFLKSNIQIFNKLTTECFDIVEKLKINRSSIINLQEELTASNAVKNELQEQIGKLTELNADLKLFTETQTKVEKEIQAQLDDKSTELNEALIKLDEIQLVMRDNEVETNSNVVIINELNTELQTVKLDLEEKYNLVSKLEETKLELSTKYSDLEKCYELISKNIEDKEENEKQLTDELDKKNNILQNTLDELKEVKIKVESSESEIEKLNTLLESIKSELTNNKSNLELINELNNLNSELELKLKQKDTSEIIINEELLTKTKELECVLSQVTDLQLKIDFDTSIIEKLNNELYSIKIELEEKSELLYTFESNKSETIKCNNLELNEVITKLKLELEEKSNKEDILKNQLEVVNTELEDTTASVFKLKSDMEELEHKHELCIEKLNYDVDCIKSTLEEKTNLIVELENTNLELSTKYENFEITNNKMSEKLQIKNLLLENALLDLNEIDILVERMENKMKSNILMTEELKSELVTKSNLLTNLETINSELLVKCAKNNDDSCKNLQDQLEVATQENALIQTDLNLTNQKYLDSLKHHEEIKLCLENKLKLQVFNYQTLYTEFVNLSSDIELLLRLQMNTESNLRAEILVKSTEIDDLLKQIHESSLQTEYDKLEEEYILKTRECDEAQEKMINLESIISTKEESEKILKHNFESKCTALDEYKKNVEFLFSRNDSFQIRVNDFEDNVLVGLSEEFDLMKSELTKKVEYEKTFLEEKADLECKINELQEELSNVSKEMEEFDFMKLELAKKNEYEKTILEEKAHLECELNELQGKLSNVTKEMELSEERSEDLASIINVLVIEIKDANSMKENLEYRLNEAERELLETGGLVENLDRELSSVQKEFENSCFKTKCVESELQGLKTKLNDKIDKNHLEGCDVRNQLFDPLVDYVHEIKLKLTELNSAMISGNQSEKQFRTKVMSVEDDISAVDSEVWKLNCNTSPLLESPNIRIDLEIDNLRKLLEDKTGIINTLQKAKNDVENNFNELQDELNNLTNENNKLIQDIKLMENDLKEKSSLIGNLNNELSQLKIQYTVLEEHNQASNDQIHHSLDIDLELRDGKKNLINEINLLEPGKINGIPNNHNLSNLFDTFVSLIMTKEQQILIDLNNDHNKNKQMYEEQINQYQEDIKKGKEWQEQVENDNEKLCLELENLKSEKHNFPSREIEIKELREKVLEAENQSFEYLSELQDLKAQFNKMNEESYQVLSNEFELFRINSEKSIQDLKMKLEDQKHSYSTLEIQLQKCQSECSCLNDIIKEKDEDVKNLIDQIHCKTVDYEKLLEKNCHQKDEIKDVHIKKIDELLLELNDKTQQVHNTEKLLKEMTKNYNQLVEDSSLNTCKIKLENDNSALYVRIAELEHNIKTIKESHKAILETLETELNVKDTKLQEIEAKCSNIVNELELSKLKISAFEKQLESCHQTLKLKDDQIENYHRKSKIDDNNSIEVNNITDKLREILKCTGTLSTLYENISSLVTKCDNFEEEIEELKRSNTNLDDECEAMLLEIKSKDDKILYFLTQEDELKQNIELLTDERNILKNKCDQNKNYNDNIKKLNDEICGYEQNIYQLRKEKGQLIMTQDKEVKQLKSELNEAHAKNLELLNEYNKLSETAKNSEKLLKEDIQQLNRCIVDKNAKISTLDLLSKTNIDEVKKKNNELEHVYRKVRDENRMLLKELRRLKEITKIRKADQCTQTVEEQSVVSSAMVAGHKSMTEKIIKLENDNQVMKKMLHHRKAKIEELQKQLDDKR